MPRNTYYHYDHESCTFVEVKPRSLPRPLMIGAVVLALLLLPLGGLALLRTLSTPEAVALQQENEALQQQLSQATQRLRTYSSQVDELAEKDRELYRTLLQADPISEDVQQVGVGGSRSKDADRFSAPTSNLLRENADLLSRLERQVNLQSVSFRELAPLAQRHRTRLDQTPAMLPVNGGHMTSGFGMRLHPIFRVRKMHEGVDFTCPVGTPVYATADGVVAFTGYGGGYGNLIKVDHREAGLETRYAHLSRFAPGIRPGVAVKRGQVIAYSGNTGYSTAPHLHYEVRELEGVALNPVTTFAPGMDPAEYQALLQEAQADNAMLGF